MRNTWAKVSAAGLILLVVWLAATSVQKANQNGAALRDERARNATAREAATAERDALRQQITDLQTMTNRRQALLESYIAAQSALVLRLTTARGPAERRAAVALFVQETRDLQPTAASPPSSASPAPHRSASPSPSSSPAPQTSASPRPSPTRTHGPLPVPLPVPVPSLPIPLPTRTGPP